MIFLFMSLIICGQDTYESAKALYESADSIRQHEDNKLDRSAENYHLAISRFQEARELFQSIDAVYDGFRCEVGVLKCQHLTRELDMEHLENFKQQLIDADVQDTLLAQVYYYVGAKHIALRQFEQAIPSFEKALLYAGDDFHLIINTHWYLGWSWSQYHNPILQIDYYERAINMLERAPKGFFATRALFLLNLNLIDTYVGIGRYQDHLEAINDCYNLLEEYPHWFSRSNKIKLRRLQAESYFDLGNFQRSHDSLVSILADDFSSSVTLTLGLVLKSLERHEEALSLYHDQLSKPLPRRETAKVYNNMGLLFLDLQELDSALHYMRRALCINIDLNNQRSQAINLGNLADIYSLQGLYAEADSVLFKALALPSSNQLEIRRLISKNYQAMGNHEQALKYAESAVLNPNGDLVNQYEGDPFERKLASYRWLLGLYETQGDFLAQEKSIVLIEKIHDRIKQSFHLSTGEVFDITSHLSFIYDYGTRVGINLFMQTHESSFFDKAFRISEWSKVQALQRAKISSSAKFVAGVPKSVIDREQQLKAHESFLRSGLSDKTNGSGLDSVRLMNYQRQLTATERIQDTLEIFLQRNYPRYYELKYQDVTLSVKEIQDRLTSSQAFIEYYQGDTTSYVFTITKEDYEVVPIDLETDTLITAFRTYFEPENFELDQQELDQLSFQVYQNYLEPALGSLHPAINELIVVPDGKLSYVPFDVLLTVSPHGRETGDQAYLLRKFQVHYTYSASMYFNEFTTLSTKDEFLAFAPTYDNTLSDTSVMHGFGSFRNQITPLHFNQKEVSFIASNFRGVDFLGESAHERNFKENVDEYGVLHLAMHTIVDDEDPMQSRLVFSNSKDPLEDDKLHAFELYNMRIPSKLTVLSACETGFGKLARGEGALSLARAFAYAGSPSVVMSHWPVDDQTTSEVMRNFYNYLADGYAKSEALRKAKLDFLDQTHSARMHPFFWGSFVVMGDDSPVRIKRRTSGWHILGVCFMLLLAGLTSYLLIRSRGRG